MAQQVATTHHCPQCERAVRIIEANAFGGRDTSRVTLACGHVVSKAA